MRRKILRDDISSFPELDVMCKFFCCWSIELRDANVGGMDVSPQAMFPYDIE